MAARTFGPATGGVLALLWAMVIATVVKYGVHLPDLNLAAFNLDHIHFTIGGYVRILAVMTGIEVFANLVAAYDGKPNVRSRRAFNSLLIIMGTTGITMLIVGPAIYDLADPLVTDVSVFTQTMDALLPAPLPFLGTLVGVAVLMSASAASSQGLQNLSLGLKERRYIPPMLGRQNQFQVADKPVWIQVGIVSLCFLFFGTHEETYLALYAAGVFILLSMTGWAVTKRLVRQAREAFSVGKLLLIVGTVIASLLTTAATVIIFEERFLEGAWSYFVLIPLLYALFTYFRSVLGAPTAAMDYLGRFNAYQLAGFGFGQGQGAAAANGNGKGELEIQWQPEPIEQSNWRDRHVQIKRVATLLDGSRHAATAIPYVKAVCKATGAKLTLLSSVKDYTKELQEQFEETKKTRQAYLDKVQAEMLQEGIEAETEVRAGFLADATAALVEEKDIDLVITSTRGKSGRKHWLHEGVSSKLMRAISKPVLLVQDEPRDHPYLPEIRNILVSLDGSIHSESALPYARALAAAFHSEIHLLTVPEVPEAESYRAPMTALRLIREQTVDTMDNFLDAVSRSLRDGGVPANYQIKGSLPIRTIVSVGEDRNVDLIAMTSRGRGGLDRLFLGSVAESVVERSSKAVLMVPIHEGSKDLGLVKEPVKAG
jgi:nucleotide-binding universal stress UspA family protein